MYLLTGSTVITSINQQINYPNVALNTNNSITNPSLYYVTSTDFHYVNGTTDIGLPGYPSQLSNYSILTNAVPTLSMVAQGSINLSMFVINQVCS